MIKFRCGDFVFFLRLPPSSFFSCPKIHFLAWKKRTKRSLCLDCRPTCVQCLAQAAGAKAALKAVSSPLTPVLCLTHRPADIYVCCRIPAAPTRAVACARSTSTSDVTSTGNGSTSPKVIKPTSVLATVRTSGAPTTTITW